MVWNGRWWITALSLILSTLGTCLAYPSGAPGHACGDMLPSHRGSEQHNGTYSPYHLAQEKVAFQPNDVILVTLYSESKNFMGFMVKALDAQDNPVGQFERSAVYKSLGRHCSAVTHVNKKPKTIVNMLWKAPASTTGRVHFKATVVQNYRLFYRDVMSETKS
ncbi:ferric-chelate reductase 1-like [Amblyomma americanum]